MESAVERFRTVRQPPLWLYPLLVVATPLAFAAAFPVGLDVPPEIVLEGTYLAVAVAVAVPIRRLEIGVLELGWMLFLFGRYVDFLDELFVESEPLVEPYLSGLLVVVSFSVLLAGAYALLTEYREQLDALDARNEELELKNAAIEEAPIGVTVADMRRDDEPLVVVNDGFARLTGYEVERTLGTNCRFLQGEGTSEESVARMRRAIDDGEPVQETIRNYRKDGTPFWNQITLAPLERDGEIPHYVGFQQDVTDRVEYERQLQDQRDDLYLLSQLVRHDIRNDLHVIKGYVDLLDEYVVDDGEELLEPVEEQTEHAIELTTTARELGDTMLNDERELEPTALAGSLGGQVEAVRSAHEEAAVELRGPIPEVTVAADGMLDSVFRNLLKNAIQHNTADVPEVIISTEERNGTVRVRVADDGPGVPAERKEEIFGRGEKGTESGGTGIGTYLVGTLVTRYGGDVWVEDNEPRGAVFVVELPIVE
jgi:PAS domain S-box-containing protein